MRLAAVLHVASFAVCIAAGTVGACSTFSSADGPPGADASPDEPDAADDDASLPSDASLDAPDAPNPSPTNILSNGDFEVGCGAWKGGNATLTPERGTIHSGSGACLVCGESGGGGYALMQQVSFTSTPGRQLIASFWVHPAADAGAAAPNVGSLISTLTSAMGTLDSTPTGISTLNGSWEQILGLVNVTKVGGELVLFEIVTDSVSLPSCFVVDDVVLYETGP